MIGLFCKRALLKSRYSAKETYDFKEPTNRSHLIVSAAWYRWILSSVPHDTRDYSVLPVRDISEYIIREYWWCIHVTNKTHTHTHTTFILQHTATHYNALQHSVSRHVTAESTHWHTPPHTATHCNTPVTTCTGEKYVFIIIKYTVICRVHAALANRAPVFWQYRMHFTAARFLKVQSRRRPATRRWPHGVAPRRSARQLLRWPRSGHLSCHAQGYSTRRRDVALPHALYPACRRCDLRWSWASCSPFFCLSCVRHNVAWLR